MHMLSHKFRFHGHGSLRYLFRNGRSKRSRLLMVRFTPNKTRVHSRYAIVVSKKILKSAAKRNRVRRRIFEVIRLHEDTLPTGYDISITVFSPELLTLSHESLEKEVLSVLQYVHTVPAEPAS